MNREIVPVALDRRRQHQHASGADRALDEQRRTVLVRDQHLVVVADLHRAVSEEAHRMPIARLAQHRMRRRDLADRSGALLRLADAPVIEQRSGLDRSARAERREHRAAGRNVFLDALRLDVRQRAVSATTSNEKPVSAPVPIASRRALFDVERGAASEPIAAAKYADVVRCAHRGATSSAFGSACSSTA